MPAIEEEVGQLLRDKGLTIAVAEACTAGLIGSMLCSVPGSSRYFYGGVIAYTGGSKARVLGISEELLQREGTVSPAAALEMARKGRQLLDTGRGGIHNRGRRTRRRLFRQAHRTILYWRGCPGRVRGHQGSYAGPATGTPIGRTRQGPPLSLVKEYLLQKV